MYTASAGRVPRDKLSHAAAMALQRLLLLIPTTTYRTEDFVEAGRTLDVDLVIASDRPNMMAGEFPDHLLTLPFDDPAAAAREMRGYAARRPLDAVVPVDDVTTVVASASRRGARPAREPARGGPGHAQQAGDARPARARGGALAAVHHRHGGRELRTRRRAA